MRMAQGGTGTFAVVLENDDRLHSAIAEEIDKPCVQALQNTLYLFDRLMTQEYIVFGGLNEHLVRPAASHSLEDLPLLDPLHSLLDSENRKLIGNDPDLPGPGIVPNRKDFMWRQMLVSRTERAFRCQTHAGLRTRGRVVRAMASLRRKDHPVMGCHVVS